MKSILYGKAIQIKMQNSRTRMKGVQSEKIFVYCMSISNKEILEMNVGKGGRSSQLVYVILIFIVESVK